MLYHNPEQLRLVRQLFDITAPGGFLVIESATARRAAMRNDNCVEIWFPPDKPRMRKLHLSPNITHLPSARAIESWLHIVGFTGIERSQCHRRVTRGLAATRAAYVATRAAEAEGGIYYGIRGHKYQIGRAR